MTSHEWFVEHRVDYVTRTLDPDDQRTFTAHLAQCDECRGEVGRIEADLAWLPMGAPPAAPRPGLRRRIVQDALEGGLRRTRRWPVPAAIAAGLLLAAGTWLAGRSGTRALETALAERSARVAALEDTLSIIRQAGRVLQAQLEMGEARGGLVIFADEVSHRWNVVVHGLPPAPPGGRYQFWFICADGMVRGAEVRMDRSGSMMFTTGMPETGCKVMGAALTVEPMDNSDGPPRGKALAHLML
jgi:anti-sigma-K factor RskA